MNVWKQAEILKTGAPSEEQLELIAAQTKGTPEAKTLYVFAVRLCDDQVDRDLERFDTAALPRLGELFLGKPGIVDHNWSAEKQVARIFQTQVETEAGVSWLRAWAYVRRAGNEGLIGDIECGIRREVSVSCRMGRRQCSICGGDAGSCGHTKGESYDGTQCVTVLAEPLDAYEFSFVAVPAQPKAGVVKALKGGERMELETLVKQYGGEENQAELQRLGSMAALGETWISQLRQDAVRLGMALDLGLRRETLEDMTKALGPETLRDMQKALEKQASQRFPGTPQLGADAVDWSGEKDPFLI